MNYNKKVIGNLLHKSANAFTARMIKDLSDDGLTERQLILLKRNINFYKSSTVSTVLVFMKGGE